MSKIIGIDISKSTFDVSYLKKDKWEHKVFKNQSTGFEQFKKTTFSNFGAILRATSAQEEGTTTPRGPSRASESQKLHFQKPSKHFEFFKVYSYIYEK